MTQSISFDYNEDTNQFHLLLDGEDMGPVDEDDLREESSSLYLHFHLFREPPEPADIPDDASTESLSDEEIDELIEDVVSLEDDL